MTDHVEIELLLEAYYADFEEIVAEIKTVKVSYYIFQFTPTHQSLGHNRRHKPVHIGASGQRQEQNVEVVQFKSEVDLDLQDVSGHGAGSPGTRVRRCGRWHIWDELGHRTRGASTW